MPGDSRQTFCHPFCTNTDKKTFIFMFAMESSKSPLSRSTEHRCRVNQRSRNVKIEGQKSMQEIARFAIMCRKMHLNLKRHGILLFMQEVCTRCMRGLDVQPVTLLHKRQPTDVFDTNVNGKGLLLPTPFVIPACSLSQGLMCDLSPYAK